VKVFDHKLKEEVALKIIRSPKKFHTQAKVEVKVLKYMMQHKAGDFNITELKSFFVFRKHVVSII
jgi:dual specificity tyrosine-phosphorylation-regulated kinase 2/3/4